MNIFLFRHLRLPMKIMFHIFYDHTNIYLKAANTQLVINNILKVSQYTSCLLHHICSLHLQKNILKIFNISSDRIKADIGNSKMACTLPPHIL